MPRPRQPSGPSEIRELRIIMEEVRSGVKQLVDGLAQLRREMQRGLQELRVEMNGRFTLVEQALKEVSQRLKAHEETHAA